MRIAQVTKYFHPHIGGMESNVLGISKGFVDRGHEVLVFTSNKPKTKNFEVFDGVNIHRFAIHFVIFNAPFIPGIFTGLMREDYDVIHLHLPDPFNSIFALIASKIKRKPLVITYHADIIKDEWHHLPFKFFYNIFLNIILKNSKSIIATTPNYIESSEVLKKFKDRIEVVPNFVDTDRFKPELNGDVIKKLHNLEDKKIILFLGRLVPYKGVEYLIRAFSNVKKKVKNSALLIVGNGPLKQELKDMVAKLEVEDIIFVSVPDKDTPLYYACCDLFVLPSITRQEAFGIALLEAMSSGKPVITTNISGMPYVVDDAGIAVKPKDTKALESAILHILSTDIGKELGKKSRKRVEQEFSLDIVTEKLLKIYERHSKTV